MLRLMNEAGVLGRFVPEFGKVVAMMQFSMYHHYTVDEHLVRTVGEMKRIADGKFADTLPLSTEIFSSVINKRALLVAALMHDVGKGQKEDHSIIGERVLRSLGPRLGLTPAETETAAPGAVNAGGTTSRPSSCTGGAVFLFHLQEVLPC